MDDRDWGRLADELAADVRRVSARLRGLSQARLAGPPRPPEVSEPLSRAYESCAEAGRAAAQALADTAAALEAAATGAPLVRRRLPRLSDFAVGDQVAVTGHDLLAALVQVEPDRELGVGTVRISAAEDVAATGRQLADVRRRI